MFKIESQLNDFKLNCERLLGAENKYFGNVSNGFMEARDRKA